MLFLSHSSADEKRALALKSALEEEGFEVWLDKKELAPGASLSAELVENISKADALVLIGSKAALASNWVRSEVDFAAGREIPILPVSWEDLEWPRRLP